MNQVQTKEAIRQTYLDRQAAREDDRLDVRSAETAADIRSAEIENRMSVSDGLAFLRAGGVREDAA